MTVPPRKDKVMANSPYAERDFDALFTAPPPKSQLPDTCNTSSIKALPQSERQIDHTIIVKAMTVGVHKPQVSLYSPMLATILAYLDLTKPQFCKSEVGTEILEQAFRKRFPELWEYIEIAAKTEQVWIDANKKRRTRKFSPTK